MPFGQILFFLILVAVPLSGTATDLDKAVDLRKTEQFSKAEQLLKKYSSPAKFDSLNPTEKIEFLRGLLELAHIRALKDDVSGSLALLNWAEGRKDPYQRAISCVKYAEILLDLDEFERASAYLKNADEIISKRATEEESGAAIGQGGAVADTGAIWRDLKDDASALKAEIEAETLKKKFGASYGNYVKLRRLQVLLKRSRTPRYQKEAMRLADELIETDPASQFAAAAGYLKGEILASRLKENSPKKEIKEVKDYLDKFVRQQPDGIYRGEALMLLGKISLEIEWNAKDAEKYYSQALDWFRKAREKRDAVSLYAAMNDDLKKQSTPTQKPTTLDYWKRIVFHDEDPLKLYNTANAPVWYENDKERSCSLALGFIMFSQGKIEIARKYWSRILELSPELQEIDPRFPNVHKRLQAACNVRYMAFTEKEKSPIKNMNLRLKLQFAEYLYLQERFDDAIKIFADIAHGEKSVAGKAVALLGQADCEEIKGGFASKEKSAKLYKWILSQKKIVKEDVYAAALYRYGFSLRGVYRGEKTAEGFFLEYIKNFPEGRYKREAEYHLIECYLFNNKPEKANTAFRKFRLTRDIYVLDLEDSFKLYKQGKIGGIK